MTGRGLKPVTWMGRSLRDLKEMPVPVRRAVGRALYWAQIGDTHPSAKPLRGNLSAVMEIVSDYDGDTYRAAYTIRLEGTVYVLHTFQKKSHRGIATPQADLVVIKNRLRDARELHARRQAQKRKE